MSNPNEPQNYGKEVSKEIHNTTDGRVDVTKTTETVNGSNAYKDGFVNGQVAESYQEDALVARDNENAGRGLLIGILLASLAAITAGAVWFANQSNDVNTVTPVVLPVPNRAEPSIVPEIRTETKIIEKNTEVLVPVPQQQASPAPKPSAAAPAQNINITVPPATQPSPAAKQVPATETAPPKSDTSSSSDMQSTTTTETAPPKSDTSNSPDMQSTTTTENSTTTTDNSTETPATDGSN